MTTAKNLPPKLLFCTLLLGLLSALAFIEWSWYRVDHHSFTNTNKLYQTETSRLSLFTEFNLDSIDRVSLGITLVFHGMFTISHCIHLIALQKIKGIALFPHHFSLKAVLFLSFLRLGSFIGFIGYIVTLGERNKSEKNKEDNDATTQDVIRVLMGRIAWWSSALIWMQLAYAYGVLVVVAHQRRRQRISSWRSLIFIFGDYRMIPSFAYGSAGFFSIVALLFAKMGHWCEPALVGCLLGDVAGLHQVWLLLGGGNDNESDGGGRGGQVKNE